MLHFGRLPRGLLGLTLLISTLGSSCAPASRPDVSRTLERLRSGELIEEMNADASGDESARVLSLTTPLPVVRRDPCPEVPRLTQRSTPAHYAQAAERFGACARRLGEPVRAAMNAIHYFKEYRLAEGVKPFSQQTPEEIFTLYRSEYRWAFDLLGTDSPLLARERITYTDEDLAELLALVDRRRNAARLLEAQLARVVELKSRLFQRLERLDRYAVLKVLVETREDSEGEATFERLEQAVGPSIAVPDRGRFPLRLLHPYALLAVIPEEGKEIEPLNGDTENPFEWAAMFERELELDDTTLGRVLNLYRQMRDRGNPDFPELSESVEGAARVAFLDTGIDWLRYPDLALFLSQNREGEIRHADVSDLDDNSYVPYLGQLGHGSRTMGSLLTILARQAPEMLSERKLQLSMWKVASVRALLAGAPFDDLNTWDSRDFAAGLAIAERIRAVRSGQELAPHVVSVSMHLVVQEILEKVRETGILRDAPWLWVMAAGNQGGDIAELRHTCFADVPAAERVDDRILCVGALVQGMVYDQIANYSNYGDRVDVYAYDSYWKECPDGTSCATPAVAAVAARIQAQVPGIRPEEIKRAIVESSEERLLRVDQSFLFDVTSTVPRQVSRRVKVFDPVTMGNRALERARALRAQATAPQPSARAASPRTR